MMRSCRKDIGFVVTLVAGLSLVADASGAASFQGLGDLSGGAFDSNATFVSGDGMTVLGTSQSASGAEAFKWTPGGGMAAFTLFPDGAFSSGSPTAITNDGSVISGTGTSTSGVEAFRWTQSGGAIGLGDLPGGIFRSDTSAMSADGSVIVGSSRIGGQVSDKEAFIWTQANGMIGLGDLPGGLFESRASDVSADGTVVVGEGTIVLPGDLTETPKGRAFRWTEAGGMVDLGSPAPGLHIFAQAVSADGAVVVGNTYDGLGLTMPFRWTEGSGMVLIDEPVGGEDLARPIDVSANGSTIVGQTFTSNGPEAIVWDQTNSVRYLQDILVNDLGLDLTGWTLASANAISDDGLTIAGWGTNPNGDDEAFVAVLPEPGTVVLMALGMSALFRRR